MREMPKKKESSSSTDCAGGIRTWEAGEPGPTCLCGKATIVVTNPDPSYLPVLICFAHTPEEASFFPLPVARPLNWPNLNNEEMKELVERGIAEHDHPAT